VLDYILLEFVTGGYKLVRIGCKLVMICWFSLGLQIYNLVLCINWIGEIETNNNVIVIIENNNIEDEDKDNK
jgi:hypothetical protein